MSSYVPPNPWYNGIIYNPEFFTANTNTISVSYANKTYLRRIGNPTSIATLTTFTNNVSIQGALQFIDATSMNSAYTGAGALMGSYTNTNLTINGNGKITAISSGTGAIPTLANVLLAGNSAGATSINMNNNPISNATNITLSGTSAYIGTTSTTGNLILQTANTSTGSIGFNVAGIGGVLSINNLGTVSIPLKLTAPNINDIAITTNGNTSSLFIGNTGFITPAGANNNVCVGKEAGLGLIAGITRNVNIGSASGRAGGNSFNTNVGAFAGVNATGQRNTLIGNDASGGAFITGDNNSALGDRTIIANGLSYATAIGSGANATTSNTIQLGRATDNVNCPNTLTVNTTTFGNGGNTSAIQIGNVDLAVVNNNSIQLGNGANLNALSSHNIAIGNYANSAGNNAFNTIVGSFAMPVCSGGSNNTCLGHSAGDGIFSGSSYTCIGKGSGAGDALTHATALGANSFCPTSNTIALGRSSGEDNVLIYGDLILQTTQPTNTNGYLGYTNQLFANNIATLTSGVIFNNITAGFSLDAGVYLFNLCIYDLKNNAGRLTTLKAGISTSSSSQVGGFSNWVFGHQDYSGSAVEDVIGNLSYTFSVPSTATYYYLQLSTNTIALSNTAETFIQYTRIA